VDEAVVVEDEAVDLILGHPWEETVVVFIDVGVVALVIRCFLS
jgi:hypothetical protein